MNLTLLVFGFVHASVFFQSDRLANSCRKLETKKVDVVEFKYFPFDSTSYAPISQETIRDQFDITSSMHPTSKALDHLIGRARFDQTAPMDDIRVYVRFRDGRQYWISRNGSITDGKQVRTLGPELERLKQMIYFALPPLPKLNPNYSSDPVF